MNTRTKTELLDKVRELKGMLQPGSGVSQRRIRLQLLALETIVRRLEVDEDNNLDEFDPSSHDYS